MIMLLKSSFSINSYDGCGMGCKYCILSTLEHRQDIEKIYDEEQLVEDLKNFKYYNEFIPITINNITDPFFNNKIFESTVKILNIIKAKNLKNPCVIITKAYLSDKQIEILSKIDLNFIILYSYSGLAGILENTVAEKQVETLKKLSLLKNITLLHYYRPIIEGINSDEESMKKIAESVTKYCKASVIAGIRINSHLKDVFNELNIEIPFKFDTEHKVILNETYNRAVSVLKKTKENYLCFKKTSCALSYFCNMADYNGHSGRINYCSQTCPSYQNCFAKGNIGFCDKNCPNFMRCKESSEKLVTEENVKDLLQKIGKNNEFEILQYYIYIKGEFHQDEVTYLRHNLKRNVKVDKLKRCNNEDKLSE